MPSKSLPFPIVTASWHTRLPSSFVRIGISRGAPRRHPAGYRRYPRLHPGPWLDAPDYEFVRRYEDEILGVLDVNRVLADLHRIGGGAPVALLCFERCGTSDGWCHRAVVSQYFEREAGLQVYEYGFEALGCGTAHPMRAPNLRVLPSRE